MNTTVTFDDHDQINTYVSFDDSLDSDNGTHVEQSGTSSDSDSELLVAINDKYLKALDDISSLKAKNAN